MSRRRGIPFVVAAPSGTGKTTVCRRLVAEDDQLEFSVSHTTRPARNGETDGVDYYFVSRKDFEALRAEGQVRLFTATPSDTDTPEGGLAVLHDGHTAHYWIAGSAPGPAMTVLLGHTLPRLRDDGIKLFDFVGAHTPSIAEFKRHFGPVLTPYFYLEKITRPELRLLYRLKGRRGHF